MNFLVMGSGSIGRRHIMNLISLFPDSKIDVFDSDPNRIKEIQDKYSINQVDENAINKKYDCILICTPPSTHIDIAIKGVKNGSNIFIEKPLSNSLNQLDNLLSLIEEKQCLVFVGFNLRFHKATNLIKEIIDSQKLGNLLHASAYFGQYLPDWRPWQDYRKNYTAQKNLGGGIIQDASHEIDYLRWLIGEPISIQSNYVNATFLEADTEAISNIIIQFEDNILAQIHLDFVRREYKRSLELLFENGIVDWDYSNSTVKVFDGIKKSWKTITFNESDNEMYLKEISHVVKCINDKIPSTIIDLNNGINTFKISERIKHKSH
jgi:predicted dehydrogenase